MKQPVISIITPCYNAESYIRETINSVISQSFKNWEMIIVDDCSSDNSATIIKDYVAKDSRIRYVKTTMRTGSPAIPRNLGIRKACGDYIAFLDSDDLWLPTKLESQLHFMKSRNVDFVYSYYSRLSSEEKIGGTIKSPERARYKDICKRDFIPMLTIMVRKNILNGIQFENRPKEDFVFLLRLLKTGIIAYNTKENVARYRIVQQSRSSNKWNMLYEHYLILREDGFNIFVSAFYTLTHCIAAYLKYRK